MRVCVCVRVPADSPHKPRVGTEALWVVMYCSTTMPVLWYHCMLTPPGVWIRYMLPVSSTYREGRENGSRAGL